MATVRHLPATAAGAVAAAGEVLAGLGLAALLGGGCGAMALGLQQGLAWANAVRTTHPQVVLGLPVTGLVLGLALSARVGRAPVAMGPLVEVMARHQGGEPHAAARLGWAWGPLVALGTIATHLFGGSAGREGAAVQLGAWLADRTTGSLALARWRPSAYVAGVAGGFGGAFGCPLAGALFALELAAIGRVRTAFMPTALAAALAGDAVMRRLGGEGVHAAMPPLPPLPLDGPAALSWGLLAAAVVLACRGLIGATAGVRWLLARARMPPPLRMAAGGLALAATAWWLPVAPYLGLGQPLLDQALGSAVPPAAASVAPWAWLGKLTTTAWTLGAGFLGGEVTPLFVIGACLGHALAPTLGLPHPWAAGMGLTAMFGCAARMPLTATVMAAELFGQAALLHAAWISSLVFLARGRGIYRGQRRLPTG